MTNLPERQALTPSNTTDSPVCTPIQPGATVHVYSIPTSGFPQEEGRACIVECIDPHRELYRVRFDEQPDAIRVRVVISAWQHMSPDRVLEPLIAHWRAHLSRAAFGDIDYGPASDFPPSKLGYAVDNDLSTDDVHRGNCKVGEDG